MITDIEITADTPAQFSEAERASFVELVRAGGEVGGEVLERNIANAKVLVMLKQAGQIMGVAALKRPLTSYRKRIGEKAQFNLAEDSFPYELGYIFIVPEARGQRLSGKLVTYALGLVPGSGVFATVRADNEPMLATLAKAGFKPAGEPYEGRDSRTLCVLVRQN